MEETAVRDLFRRYERLFREALSGTADMGDVAGLYAAEFIAASPAGVMTGKNDGQLRRAMAEGYAQYRAIGMTDAAIRDLRIWPMDAHHCVAHVGWTATYARPDGPDVAVDFDVHYLVQNLGQPRVFGWVSGDEQALLKEKGIV